MKVTRRERNLLAFLALVAAVALIFVFIIMPLQASITAEQALNATLKDQQTIIESQIALGHNIDSKVAEALANVNTEFAKIESPISSEEFELRLQPILVVNNISIKSWIVNDPIVTVPKLPTYENAGYVYKLKELVDNYRGSGNPISTIPVTDAELVLTNVIFTFTSSYTDYVKVLDAVVSWNSTSYVSSSSRDNTTGVSVVSIDFYSIEKP